MSYAYLVKFVLVYSIFLYALCVIEDVATQKAVGFFAQAFVIIWVYKMTYYEYPLSGRVALGILFLGLILFSRVDFLLFLVSGGTALVCVPLHKFGWERERAKLQ